MLLDAVLAEIVNFYHFHLEIVRDQGRYNLGDVSGHIWQYGGFTGPICI